MLDVLKNIVTKLIGYANYRKLLTKIMRILNRIDEKSLVGDNIINMRCYSVENKDCFFGYYDLPSINQDNTKLLSLAVSQEVADIGYFDIETSEFHKIADSRAWNWQMGSRLRWYDDNQTVLFNDYDGENFISRIVDLNGKEIRRFPFPIFDLDEETQNAYFTDFTVLHYLREGYGYSNKKVDFDNYYKTIDNGLFKASLSNDSIELIMSIERIKNIQSKNLGNGKYHYVNHISVNHLNGDIMFFHLWTDGGKTWRNRILFLNNNGEVINVIDDFDRASHYCWKDGNHILVTVMVGGKAEYRLYNYRSGEYELMEGIKTDGHPSFMDDRIFITDTYPNRCAMQSIYICDSKTNTYKNIFSVYHQPRKVGPERCDLHPRIKGKFINIDSVPGGNRCQYILETQIETRDSSLWERRLVLDKNAVVSNSGPRHKNLLSCINSEYLFTTGRKKSNIINVLYMFLFGPVFRANTYVCWMQKSSHMFKRKWIRNKLEVKYSVVIDQNCKIGCHFRMDHCVGIVIGPGSVIGDYVKMYQNVTVGQKNGKFPKIGNHVVIYPGAKIIGDITIGDYAIIGANAVVTKDVPEGATVAGVPAKIIGEYH